MKNKPKILLVDDEPINIKLLHGILRKFDLEVLVATSGEEALKVAAGKDFALILLDIMMPGMDGFDCAERLREKPETRSTPIIFVTAINKDQSHIFRGYELGAVDYLFKPVEPDILRSKVRTFVELQAQRQGIQRAADRLGALVGELEQSRKALEDSERRYRIVADYNYDWESWIGPDGDTLYVSPACERISGYPRERFINDSNFMETLIHSDDMAVWRDFLLSENAADGDSIDFRIYNNSARVRWVNAVKRTVEEDGEHLGNRVSLRDVTDRKELQERMQYQALHDPMTGLPNRSLCLERIQRARQRSRQNEGMFAVMLLDLDRFKVINESMGHAAGDKFLAEISERLRSVVGEMDTVGRFGGDEFVLILEDVADTDFILEMAWEIMNVIKVPFITDGEELRSSASMGVVVVDNKVLRQSSESILHDAHIALYTSKEEGKGIFSVFREDMREKAVKIITLENDLRRALSHDEFLLHYQPLVDMGTCAVSGFETLVRWQHPERGLVSPGEFIPIAEESGLIVDMGEWILRNACSTFTRWLKDTHVTGNLFFSVNISPRQFREASLVPMVADILKTTGLEPRLLKLEITETVLMLDVMDSVKKLMSLKDLGVTLSIDDFGTGYSSMSYLQKFPIDQLKVDLSFVQRLDRDADSIEIVRAIINLAHALRLSVVAEGIETTAQRDLLYSLQCDYGQGYLFSRPVPEAEAHALLLDPNGCKFFQ